MNDKNDGPLSSLSVMVTINDPLSTNFVVCIVVNDSHHLADSKHTDPSITVLIVSNASNTVQRQAVTYTTSLKILRKKTSNFACTAEHTSHDTHLMILYDDVSCCAIDDTA